MNNLKVITEISNSYYQFTEAEKKISDYILSNQKEVQYLSISDLADYCKVSDATISRYCRKLKFPSYSAFRLALATSTVDGLEESNQMLFSSEVSLDDTVKDMAVKIMKTDVAALKQTIEMIDSEKYHEAAKALSGARRVFCMGVGGSMVIAKEAWHLFSNSFPNFIFQEDTHLQTIVLATASPEDVLLLYSYSGATQNTTDLINLAKERRLKTILITRYLKSPGARYADIVLQCGSNEAPLQIGSGVAKIVQLFVTEILFNEVCLLNTELVKGNRESVATALAKLHL